MKIRWAYTFTKPHPINFAVAEREDGVETSFTVAGMLCDSLWGRRITGALEGLPGGRKVEFRPGPDRFAVLADRAYSPSEVAKQVDTVIVGKGLRGLLDRIGARYGWRRDPSCPTWRI